MDPSKGIDQVSGFLSGLESRLTGETEFHLGKDTQQQFFNLASALLCD
jgi:hypothetical protein